MTERETPLKQTPSSAGPPHRLGVLVVLARLALVWERLWPALWPAVGIAGTFLAVALLDVLPQLPGWLHALALVGLAGAFLVALARGLRALHLPSERQARRRLEVDSGLHHRPLTGLDDILAANAEDPSVLRLWELHRRRLAAQLRRLRVGAPRAGLAAVDPRALRAALGLILVIGVVAGHADWRQRLGRAVAPSLAEAAVAAPAHVDVWINPPAYTRIPPLFLDPERAGAEPLSVPVGSKLLAQVQGGRGAPVLEIGTEQTPFEAVAGDAYKVGIELESGERVTIRQDEEVLASWPLELVPDTAPSVEFTSPPARTERAALRLDWDAQDDYGLKRVGALIHRIDKPEEAPIEIDLPLAAGQQRKADGTSYNDLTPHPWAGLAVTVTLFAEDATGQRGESEPARTVLPERVFNHPVARALVELRKQLTLNPEARLPVVRALSEIYERPSHYFNDVVVALALLSAERRLVHDSSRKAIEQVQKLLWDTALHIEEGELAVAERDLREIQKQLMEALARNAPDEEIERLMDELERALDRFMEALAQQLQEQMAEGAEPQPLPPNAQILQSEDLKRMLDRARELARNGAREAARDLLARLQNMLENLRANPFAQGLDNQSQQAFQMMRDMESLLQRQQRLLDRSFQRSQRGAPNGTDPSEMQGESQMDAETQERLRRELGEMMRQLGNMMGDIPRPLGRAEQAMRDARDALEGNRSGEAVGPQTRAVDQLQQGMQAMADQMMQQMMGQNNGQQGMGPLGAQPGTDRDPLGRRPGSDGLEALEGVEIPDEMELRRTREILDELRKRRSQRNRPQFELDYIDRLLQQF